MARRAAAARPSLLSTSKDKVSSVNCIYSPMTHLQRESIQKRYSLLRSPPYQLNKHSFGGRKFLPDFCLIAQFGCAEASNYPSQCSIKEAAFFT